MNKVYAVGVIKSNIIKNPNHITDQRLWCLYARFEDAENCILHNKGDIFEDYYNLAIIEEIAVIDRSKPSKISDALSTPKQWWYSADWSLGREGDYHPIVCKIDRPKCMENICCILIG